MILGLWGIVNGQPVIVSESQAIQEFLANEGGLLDDARFADLQPYRHQALYPFGHEEQAFTQENVDKLCTLITAVSSRLQNIPADLHIDAASSSIQAQPTLQNGTLQDVPPDGNCGVWALLQGTNPTVDYLHERDTRMQEMQALRTQVATAVDPVIPQTQRDVIVNRIGTPVTRPGDLAHWINTEDFEHFARHLDRPIGVIVAGDGFRFFERNGAATDPTQLTLETFVRDLNLAPDTLVVYQEGVHYQTVMKMHTPGGLTWQLPSPPALAPQGPAGGDEHATGRDDVLSLGCD
ncbi:MAG: hypothetical protein LBH52_04225 [Puniceicoccales bacterium]|jgi:hypothetical protein|nr:hypothetical protein [Puniceicoccales bacterium]